MRQNAPALAAAGLACWAALLLVYCGELASAPKGSRDLRAPFPSLVWCFVTTQHPGSGNMQSREAYNPTIDLARTYRSTTVACDNHLQHRDIICTFHVNEDL